MWISLGLNLGLHGNKPATNCLSHGMHVAQEQFGVNDKGNNCMQTEDKEAMTSSSGNKENKNVNQEGAPFSKISC